MASSRKRTAQPFSKGQGARTPSEPLSAALAGKPLNAENPMNANRQLQKGASAGPALSASQRAIQQAARGRAARKLSDALNDRVGGSAPMPRGPAKGSGVKIGGPDPEGGRHVSGSLAADLAVPANQSGTRSGSTRKKQPVQKTYVSKGEINQTGNERSGKDFATFTVDGKPGEYHEYVGADGKKKTVYVAPKRRKGPAKGL